MRKRVVEFLVLAMLALGAGPVGAAMWQWSTTAGNNATADPSINWSEGMSPSSVNDSARAMMAALAAWRNDISAVNTTAGTSTAYTLTTSEGVNTTPVTGQMISFIAHATNGASPTLTVDGGNTYAIQMNGAAVPSGTVIIGSPYRVAFNGTVWMLEAGYGNPYTIPLGGFLASTSPSAPNSAFLEPAGQCISTTTYAAYWVQQGSPASGGCPGGQFAVIDVRGRALVALDTLNSVAANRLTSAASGCGTAMTSVGAVCANGAESQTLTIAQMPAHTHPNTLSDPGHIHTERADTAGGGVSLRIVGAAGNGDSGSNANITQPAVTGITITNASQGGGGAHPAVQPSIGVKYYLRVL